jgi:hypothetical protein
VYDAACMHAQLTSNKLDRHGQQTGAAVVNARSGRKHVGQFSASYHCVEHTHMANIGTTNVQIISAMILLNAKEIFMRLADATLLQYVRCRGEATNVTVANNTCQQLLKAINE